MPSAVDRSATPLEVAIGRTLAGVCHPAIAWRTQPPFRRLVHLSICFAVSYAVVLLALSAL